MPIRPFGVRKNRYYDGEVLTFAELPAASEYTGKIFVVETATGIKWINKKSAGLYRSDGATWKRKGDVDDLIGSTDVINNLTSTDTDKPLSAAQGKVLQDNKEDSANKDDSNGYVGLTGFKLNFWNLAGLSKSFFKNSNTVSREYTFLDRDGTIADDTDIAGRQPLHGNLTEIAALSPANDDVIQKKAGVLTNRTIAQLLTDLGLDNVDNTSDATKNSASATLTNKTISGTSNTISNINAGNVSSGTLAEARLPTTFDHEKICDLYVSNATAVTVATSTPTMIAQVASVVVAAGDKIELVGTGDMNPGSNGDWMDIFFYRDLTWIGKEVYIQSPTTGLNAGFALTHIDVDPGAGTYTYKLMAKRGAGSGEFGETGNGQAPTLTVKVWKA